MFFFIINEKKKKTLCLTRIYVENHIGTLTESGIVRRIDRCLLGETGIELRHVVGTSLNIWKLHNTSQIN